jgi:hypothetical protein
MQNVSDENKSITDSAEKPPVHPSRVSGRTEERLKSLEIFPFMLSMSKHSWGYSAESLLMPDPKSPDLKIFTQHI